MGSERGGRTHNKDYYNIAGRSPGPAGPLDHFKTRLSRERATIRREAEHKLPHERPLSGTERRGEGPRPQARKQSALDDLPRVVGGAGVPGSMKATPTAEPDEPARAAPVSRTPKPAVENSSYGYGVPASEDTALGRKREPFEREEEAERSRELSGVTSRVLRTFPWAFSAIGEAARMLDRPIKRTLDRLQWLGREARRA